MADPREVLLAALPTGIAVWVLPPLPCGILGVLLGLAFLAFARRSWLGFVRVWGLFALYWALAAFAAAWISGQAAPAAAQAAGIFLVRILGAFLLGATVQSLAAPMELARALAWMLRPLLGRRAAVPSLGILLMAGAMRRLAKAVPQAMAAARLRMPRRSRLARLKAVTCRILEELPEAGDRAALGAAARHLDKDACWTIVQPLSGRAWLAAGTVIVAEAALLLAF